MSGSRLRTWWARVRPPTPDLVLALVLSVLVLQPFLLLTAPLAWRRRYPMAVVGIQAAAILLVDGEFYPDLTAFVAILVGVYSVAAHHRDPVVSAAVLITYATIAAALYDDVVPEIPGPLTAFAIVAPLWLAGNSSRIARQRLDATATRAERAERERDAAIAEERERIARELHDVVTHNVSVMVVQASAARQVLEASPSSLVEVRDAMAAVERVGQQAMDELRHMLGVLGGGSADLRAPRAGLDQLDALRQRMRDSGVPVRVEVTGTVVALPAGIDLTAYRVIQEALTNVLRHAPGSAATVSVHHGAEELLVEITNSPPAHPVVTGGGGRGLAGLAERVRLYHGFLTAGVTPDGGYRVSARLPITVAS
jgi:signal transduction histidine kinase